MTARDQAPDRTLWGPAVDAGIADTDPIKPGIHAGSPLFYLVTGVNDCDEFPL